MEEAMGRLLPFHRRMVQELIETDGMCILAPGQPPVLALAPFHRISLVVLQVRLVSSSNSNSRTLARLG